MKKINQELGITIVLITHEMGVVKEICDRIAVMQDGKIIECGEVYELFARPEEPLTRSFIDSVLQLELPEHLVKNRRGTLVRLQYRGEAASDTVISGYASILSGERKYYPREDRVYSEQASGDSCSGVDR